MASISRPPSHNIFTRGGSGGVFVSTPLQEHTRPTSPTCPTPVSYTTVDVVLCKHYHRHDGDDATRGGPIGACWAVSLLSLGAIVLWTRSHDTDKHNVTDEWSGRECACPSAPQSTVQNGCSMGPRITHSSSGKKRQSIWDEGSWYGCGCGCGCSRGTRLVHNHEDRKSRDIRNHSPEPYGARRLRKTGAHASIYRAAHACRVYQGVPHPR